MLTRTLKRGEGAEERGEEGGKAEEELGDVVRAVTLLSLSRALALLMSCW